MPLMGYIFSRHPSSHLKIVAANRRSCDRKTGKLTANADIATQNNTTESSPTDIVVSAKTKVGSRCRKGSDGS